MADELTPREITNELKAFNKKLEAVDNRLNEIMRVLDGVGQQPGMRQQLRELKHYIEGNPPAMRGIIIELDLIRTSHQKLRDDFEAFAEDQGKASAKQQGTWGGAKLVWGLITGAIAFLGLLIYLLNEIQSALSKGGG